MIATPAGITGERVRILLAHSERPTGTPIVRASCYLLSVQGVLTMPGDSRFVQQAYGLSPSDCRSSSLITA